MYHFTRKIFFILLFLPLFTNAQEQISNQQTEEFSLEKSLDSFMTPVANYTEAIVFFQVNIFGYNIPFVLILLILGAIFFTIYLDFVNVRAFKHAIDVVMGKFDNPKNIGNGEVSHFQALTTALSGTVGVGNIAGVAIAISVGGPGATFWMILAGILGMTSKFAECTLGLKYRNELSDGTVSGGPMYYLRNGLKKLGYGKIGKILAAIFTISVIGASLGGGNMVQINQATTQLISVTGGEASIFFGQRWVFGLIIAVLVFLVIVKGIKSIAKVTDKLVPSMVAVYVISGIVVLSYHFTQIPEAFMKIIGGAFTRDASFGGFLGVMIMGFRRAAFSNEAGVGSASIAHSAAKTDEPVSEGVVSLLEPFIDTVVICTMTALVIIITGVGPSETTQITGESAVGLTSNAFSSVLPWFPYVLAVAVILFALSTIISWSYYGVKGITYLFGESRKVEITYKIIFCLAVILGASVNAQSVFNFGDAMVFAMAFPNIIGLIFLAKEIKIDLKDYFRRVKNGEVKKYK